MGWIKTLIDPSTRIGGAFDRLIYVLIVLSLGLFALETLLEAERYRAWFAWSETVIVAIFTVEYVLRTIGRRLAYVRSFYGVVDALAILPFYISFGVFDLRSVRILRLLRLLRMAKLRRYGSAWNRLKVAFVEIKDELAIYFGLTVALIYLASVGIYYCEHDAQPAAFQSIFDSLWWAVATLSTVGYGDVYPITVAGRLFTFLILILGLSVVSVPSGLLASALAKGPHAHKCEDGETAGAKSSQ
ncbi:MAG: ion transporter [bacterium]|nr:ion transporter [bacterium]